MFQRNDHHTGSVCKAVAACTLSYHHVLPPGTTIMKRQYNTVRAVRHMRLRTMHCLDRSKLLMQHALRCTSLHGSVVRSALCARDQCLWQSGTGRILRVCMYVYFTAACAGGQVLPRRLWTCGPCIAVDDHPSCIQHSV